MKVRDVLDLVTVIKPHALDQDDVISLLNILESEIVLSVFRDAEFNKMLPGDTDVSLRAPSPYDRIYVEYLEAKFDKYNEDMDAYSMSARIYNDTMDELRKYVRRKGLDNPKPTPRSTDLM